jgi:hypothetical protein
MGWFPGPLLAKKSQHLDLLQQVLNSLWLAIDTQLLGRNEAIDSILTYF